MRCRYLCCRAHYKPLPGNGYGPSEGPDGYGPSEGPADQDVVRHATYASEPDSGYWALKKRCRRMRRA